MKFFLDCEFNEKSNPQQASGIIELISLAIVSDQGHEFYVENGEWDPENSNDFVREHVWPNLHNPPVKVRTLTPHGWRMRDCLPESDAAWNPESIGQAAAGWVHDCANTYGDGNIKFWGYYADYDWVRLCWCFGPMIALPEGWPMYCRDLKQVLDSIGNPTIPAELREKPNENGVRPSPDHKRPGRCPPCSRHLQLAPERSEDSCDRDCQQVHRAHRASDAGCLI